MGRDGEYASNGLHFLFVPLMSQSHLLPFADLAKLFARHGPRVTLVLTPVNATRYRSVLDHATTHGLRIQFLTLAFPGAEFGIPDGCENLDSLPPTASVERFFDASNALERPIEDWIAEGRPDCIVSDVCFPWMREVAGRFSIPRLVFHGISCFTLLCSDRIKTYNIYEGLISDDERFRVPDFPDKIELTRAQIPTWPGNEDRLKQFKEAEITADGVMVNTFEELEGKYAEGYKKVVKRLWCVGPVSLDKDESGLADRGNKSSIDTDSCMNWLNSKDPKSVLYVCFGSLFKMAVSQSIELALGLESSNHSFILVIRKSGRGGDSRTGKLESWLRDYDFESRVGGKGLLIRGWAPQALILAHPAIAGFMTHCGWNSTVEGVSYGLPMITWPMFAEQFYNEKLIVEVLKIGVRVGAEAPANQADEDEDEVVEGIVRREDVRGAIEELMDDGEEGKARMRRAEEVGRKAKKAVGVGGSSYLNIDKVIQFVKELLNNNSPTAIP
ncbi:hypothetical protein MLD38_019580 [Melastoma candidum]|uniref:Uncharacterized protein n=1 Tax=Melastoma candidum TaxID=119954 RepID=A0ACB9R5R6_9MYRT|nr:hypothetical protein MLD38_019580 [Melastoma candidum]